MLEGYFLSGLEGKHILVFRTDEEDDLLLLIDKLKTSRAKRVKGLAQRLELDWYKRKYKEKKKNGN